MICCSILELIKVNMAASSSQDVHGVKFSGRHFSAYGIPGVSATEIGWERPDPKFLLGEGSFGTVYRLKSDLGRFAVKYIKFEEELRFGGIIREITYPGWLSHPGIISYHDVYMEHGQAVIVMELMDGDIYKLCRQRRFANDIDLYLSTAVQLVNAVAFLTTHGVMHRDIKGLNVLYKDFGSEIQVFLADFGFATGHTCEALPREPQAYTRTYRAPEVLLGMGPYDAKAEVWALGIVLYQMMSYTNPFSARDITLRDIIKKMAETVGFPVGSELGRRMKNMIEGMDYQIMSKPLSADRIKWKPEMKGLVLDLIEHMLDPNPVTRYTIFEVMAHPLFRGVPGRGQYYETVSVVKLSCVDQAMAFKLPGHALTTDFETIMSLNYNLANVNLIISHMLSAVARCGAPISQRHYILMFHLYISLLAKGHISLGKDGMKLIIYLLYATESFLNLDTKLTASMLSDQFLKTEAGTKDSIIADIRSHAADTARVLNYRFAMSTPANILTSQGHSPLVGLLVLLSLNVKFYCTNIDMITATLYRLGQDLLEDREFKDYPNFDLIMNVVKDNVKRLTPGQKLYLTADLDRYRQLGLL